MWQTAAARVTKNVTAVCFPASNGTVKMARRSMARATRGAGRRVAPRWGTASERHRPSSEQGGMMRRRLTWAGGLVLGIAAWLAGRCAQGVITAPSPLRAVLKVNDFIFVAKVEKLYPERKEPAAV